MTRSRASSLPDPAELDARAEEASDPIGDDAHSPLEGIVHRYPDRVLLKLVHVCPVYCRFCFRREMVGPGRRRTLARGSSTAALDYIARASEDLGSHPHRRRSAGALAAAAARGDAARWPRWRMSRSSACTRACRSVDPARITPELVRALKARGKATYVVLHANHARELTAARARGLRAARSMPAFRC